MPQPSKATRADAQHDKHPDPPTTTTGGATTGADAGATGAATTSVGATSGPATTPTSGYSAEALRTAVTGSDAAAAIRIAALNPTQAITDLGAQLSAFYTTISGGRPYSAIMRSQLNVIFTAVDFENQKKLFQAQFSVNLSGTGGTEFTQPEIVTLYAQARLLPPNQVENNPAFVNLVRGDGVAEGTHGGDTITMGAQGDAARYSQVFRHEVGHAVDDRLGGQTETLRKTDAGWQEYASIDTWIAGLGGYGTVPASLHTIVHDAANAYLGAGGTFDSPTPTFEETLINTIQAAHPGVARLPDGSDAVSQALTTLQGLYTTDPVLKACIASQGTCNYWRFANWEQAGGKVFFINHYYAKPFSLASPTWTNLVSWGDSAAAFSDKEWFAEIYADWYQAGVGGGHTTFPGYVTDFMTNVVDKMGAGATAPVAPAAATGAATSTGAASTASSVTASSGGSAPTSAPRKKPAAAGGGAAAHAAQAGKPLPGSNLGGGGSHPRVPRR